MIRAYCGKHIRDMRTKCGARARFPVCLQIKNWIVKASSIVPNQMAAFSGDNEIVLARGMPLCTFYVLIDVLWDLCP